MPLPRRVQISPEIAMYYHLISRCVRRAFLCGEDRFTGRSFEHRRQWIVDRLALLADVFAIDVCAYAIMSSHYHMAVRLAPDRAARWSAEEVVERWCRIYGMPAIIAQAEEPNADPSVIRAAAAKVEQLRERLQDVSWFMKSLNEYIARQANAEDKCTGAFWEGRFKSQALLDDRALLACMVYVDLTPIRAAMAQTPEDSDYTSVQDRIRKPERLTVPLVPFAPAESEEPPIFLLPIERESYLELVGWTGRTVVHGKRGSIPSSLAPILERLGMSPTGWTRSMKLFRRAELRFLGPTDAIRDIADRLSRRWFKGANACRAVFGTT